MAGTPEIINAIQSGEAVATGAIDAYWQGGMGLSLALAAKTGDIVVADLPEEKREWMAGAIMVTAENIDWYIENYVDSTPQFDWTDYWGRWVRGIRE